MPKPNAPSKKSTLLNAFSIDGLISKIRNKNIAILKADTKKKFNILSTMAFVRSSNPNGNNTIDREPIIKNSSTVYRYEIAIKLNNNKVIKA